MTALLRAVRRQRGLTLESVAEQTGLTKSYLSKIERRQSTPSIAVALKVARALDVDVAQLFSDQAADEKITVDRGSDRRGAKGERYVALAPSVLGSRCRPSWFDLPARPPMTPARYIPVRNSCSCTPGA